MEMEALTVGFRSNKYASSSCIRKQEMEGFNRVFSLQSVKDYLKGQMTELTDSEGSNNEMRDSEEDPGQKRSRTVKSEVLNL
jgi:hypothetical protein